MNACRRSPRLSGEPPLHPLPPAVYDYFATASHKVCLLLQGLDFRENPSFRAGPVILTQTVQKGLVPNNNTSKSWSDGKTGMRRLRSPRNRQPSFCWRRCGLQFPSRNMLKNLKSHQRSVSAAARYRELRDEGVPQADAEEMLMEQLGVSGPAVPPPDDPTRVPFAAACQRQFVDRLPGQKPPRIRHWPKPMARFGHYNLF